MIIVLLLVDFTSENYNTEQIGFLWQETKYIVNPKTEIRRYLFNTGKPTLLLQLIVINAKIIAIQISNVRQGT